MSVEAALGFKAAVVQIGADQLILTPHIKTIEVGPEAYDAWLRMLDHDK